MKRLLLLASLCLLASPALAGNTTIAITAGSGTNLSAKSYSSGDVSQGIAICDETTEYQCAAVSSGGALSVSVATALPAGTNSIGTVVLGAGTASVGTIQPGNTANTTPWLFTPYQNSANLYPNAAALADATTNPTTTGAAAFAMGFNGTTWDRLKDDSNKYLYVDLGTSIPAGTNSIGTVVLGAGSASVGTVVLGAGSASVGTVGLNAGSNTVGKVDILGNAGGTLDTAAGSPASTGLTMQGFGSAGSPSGGILTVQGASSMTALSVTGTVNTAPDASTTTNDASTITTGLTFQQIAASASGRLSFDFQNKSGNGDNCYIYFGTTASATTAKSIIVTDGWEYLRSAGAVPSDAIQVTCATSGDAYYASVQ